MKGRPDFSRSAAARLLDTTPAALLRQLDRNGRRLADGSRTVDGVTAKKRGHGVRVEFDARWTDDSVPAAWLSVEHMAHELGVSRSMLGKRLEPGRRGSTKKVLEFELLGRQIVARRLGRLWRLRAVVVSLGARSGEAA
jgi:hypothetical protein